MSTMIDLFPPYDKFLGRVVESMTPQEILSIQASEEEQERARELPERNNAGILTAEETLEQDQMLEFERMMSFLKLKRS